MTTPKSATYQSEPFEEKKQTLVLNPLLTETRSFSASTLPGIQLTVYFLPEYRQQRRRKILPRERRHPPCLSSVSQCGSTADDTAVSLDQRPHEHCGRTRLVLAPRSLSADWFDTAVNHASAREPGSPVAPYVRRTVVLLTSIF